MFMRYLIATMCLLFLSACALTGKPETALTVNLYNQTNDMVGTAKLSENPEGVTVEVKVAGVSPGFHGIHVHEIAKCDAPTFKSAGNHLNPKNKEHGLMHPQGSHLGDLPNVLANGIGEIDESLIIQGATLLKGDTSLTEKGGSSIIITEDADDGMTQVSGDSGERIICGVIKSNSKEVDREEPQDPTGKPGK